MYIYIDDPRGRAGAPMYTLLDYHHRHSLQGSIRSIVVNKLFRDFLLLILLFMELDDMTTGIDDDHADSTQKIFPPAFLSSFNIDK